MARVVVDVMPKPEILDPQGKAVTGALQRLGFSGLSVRQGKRFEIEVDGDVTDDRLAEIARAADTLLANTVIETFTVRQADSVGGTVRAADSVGGTVRQADSVGGTVRQADSVGGTLQADGR